MILPQTSGILNTTGWRCQKNNVAQRAMTRSLALCLLAAALVITPVAPVYAATHMVTNLNDNGDGSFRKAVENTNDGDTIEFASGLKGTITLLSNLTTKNSQSITLENALGISLVRHQDAGDNSVGLVIGPGTTLSGLLPGRVTARANEYAQGIISSGSMTLGNISGSVTASAGNSGAVGLLSDQNMTLNDITGSVIAEAKTKTAYGLISKKALSMGNISGSVSAKAGTDDAYGLYIVDAMTLKDITGSVSATAGGEGAYALNNDDGPMVLDNISGSVSATAGGNNAYALRSRNGSMTLKDISGSVSATAGGDNAYGLYSKNGTMTLDNISGSVTAKAVGDGAFALHSQNGSMTLKNISGAVWAEAKTRAFGIVSEKTLSLGNISGSVTALAENELAVGLYSVDDMILGNITTTGSVIAEAKTERAFGIVSEKTLSLGNMSGSVSAKTEGHTAVGLASGSAFTGLAGNPAYISGKVEARAKGLAVAVAANGGMNLYVTGILKAVDTSGTDKAYAIAAGETDGSGGWTKDLTANDTVTLGDGADITGNIDLGGGTNLLTLEKQGTMSGRINNITTMKKTGDGTWKILGEINTENLLVNAGTLTSIIQNTGGPAVTANAVTNNGRINFQLGTLVPSGTVFNVLSSTAGLNGTGSYTSPLLSLAVNGNNVQATKKNYTDVPLFSNNARTMATLLNPYTVTATGDMVDLMTKMDSAPTIEEFNICLEELVAHTDLAAMGMSTSRQFSLSTQSRMSGIRAQVDRTNQSAKTFLNPDDPDSWPLLASAGNMAGLFDRQPGGKPYGVFIKTLVQKGTRDSQDSYTGYDHDTMGLTGGIDRVFTKKFLAGISLGYARNDVDYKDPGSSHTSVNNLGTGVYASLFESEWYVDAILSGSRNTSHASRNISFLNTTAKSDQEAYTLAGKLDGGYRFRLNDIGLSPLLSLEYMYFHQDSYNETGAGAANLSVESLAGNSIKTGLGIKLDRTWKSDQWWSLTPEISARWMHEFIDQNKDVQVSMAGMPGRIFSQEAMGPKQDSLRIKAGLTALYETDFTLKFHYLGEFEEKAQSHGLSCEFQYFF